MDRNAIKRRLIILIVVLYLLVPFAFLFFRYVSKAFPKKANITINTRGVVGSLFFNWQALAQGGEERGRMFANVIPAVSELTPKYIRIDHIYDYYDVVSRDGSGNLTLNWTSLDETVCDIFATGAKPFFVLGYMPPPMSSDGTLVGVPTNWNEWSDLVQKTIERYSGRSTVLCGKVTGDRLSNIYYEVWNEPDLETFGKWSLWGGAKDYKTLYHFSSAGAQRAQNVSLFFLGGPATTAAYKNWFQVFLDYVEQNRLRIDFLSWHHYTVNPDDYIDDVSRIDSWLIDKKYKYRKLPKIITEWGYDSNPAPIADTAVGAAYTIASVRNIIDQKVRYAFSFEVKDGPTPRWGILSYQGEKKPRYHALKFMNLLEGYRLSVGGEGTYVKAIASFSPKKAVVILTNYDREGKNTELVPLTFTGIVPGRYQMLTTYLDGTQVKSANFTVRAPRLQRSVLLPPNTVAAVELIRQ